MRAVKTLCPAFALIALAILAVPDRVHAQRAAVGTARASAAGRSSQIGLGTPRLGLTTRRPVAAPEELELDARRAIVFICGPQVMMRYAVPILGRKGIPAERIFVSMERNMKCGIGLCGHCQFGTEIICRDGPVLRLDRVERWLSVREL